MPESQDSKIAIDKYLNMPFIEWPFTLQATFNTVPARDKSSLQSVADLIGIWLANGKRALTYDEMFKAE